MSNKLTARIIIGSVIILLGISMLFRFVGLFTLDLFAFWPVILIVFGVLQLTRKNNSGGVILLVPGLMFLSSSLFNYNVWGMFWPIIIIAVGVSIFFRSESSTVNGVTKKEMSLDTLN